MTSRPNSPITLLAQSQESAEALFHAIPDANVIMFPSNAVITGLCAVCADDAATGAMVAMVHNCKCVTPDNAPTFAAMFENEMALQRQHKLFASHKPSDNQMKRGAYSVIRSLVMRSLTFIPRPTTTP